MIPFFLHRACVVIGHSYGCALAVSLGRQRPDNVKMLVLVAGGGPTPLAPPTGLPDSLLLPPSFFSCCVAPLLRCGSGLLLRTQQKLTGDGGGSANTNNATSTGGIASSTAAASVAARRGRNNYFKDVYDVPLYVLHHVLMGQNWPEGR